MKIEDHEEKIKPQEIEEVAELSDGATFGEVALINNSKRQASIICHTPCHFAVLDKKDYQDILKGVEKKKWN